MASLCVSLFLSSLVLTCLHFREYYCEHLFRDNNAAGESLVSLLTLPSYCVHKTKERGRMIQRKDESSQVVVILS